MLHIIVIALVAAGIVAWRQRTALPLAKATRLEPEEFWALVQTEENPVVVHGRRGRWWGPRYYLHARGGSLYYVEAKKTHVPEGANVRLVEPG